MAAVTDRDSSAVTGGALPSHGLLLLADYPKAGPADRAALVCGSERITYADLDRLASSIAALLIRLGHGRGARVAYLGRNSAIYFAVMLGAMRSGTILVPLNWRCTAHELAFIIADAGASLLITDEELAGLATTAAPDVPIMTVAGEGGLRDLAASEPPIADYRIEPDEPAMLMFTSGTTGKPKGVVITQRMLSLARQAEAVSPDYADWRPGDVVLSPMPNFHTAACCWVLCALMRGLTCVITDDPDPANILALMRHHEVTHCFIVPTVVRALIELLEEQGVRLPSLKQIHYGAAPMDRALLERSMQVLGCGFVQHYGMTENAGTATRLGPMDHDAARPHLLKSVGRPIFGLELEIRRDDLSVASRGEAGEIWLRSAMLTPGYWQRPETTAEVMVDGWYRSGDGGYLDDEGFLFLTDRIKDMIVTGGENVYPVEVEAVLRLHPAVLDVVVFGLPDERWGECVTAAVELRAGAIADGSMLRAHARERLAGYKIPKSFRFDLPLPRTATGKLQRGAARAAALAR